MEIKERRWANRGQRDEEGLARVPSSWADVETRVCGFQFEFRDRVVGQSQSSFDSDKTLWVIGPDNGAALPWLRVGITRVEMRGSSVVRA